MKCQGCGNEFSSTLLRCPRCRRLSSRRSEGTGDSRLIEFPRRPRTSQAESAEASLPAWRIELNEKVRARKAKQISEDEIESIADVPDVQIAPATVPALPRDAMPVTANSTERDSRSFFPGDANSRRRRTEASPRASVSSASLQAASSNNPIVQAALSRARRASETASRAALPRIEASHPLPSKNSFAIDREATARVLEPPPEVSSFSSAPPAPFLDELEAPAIQPILVEQPRRTVQAPPDIYDDPTDHELESLSEPAPIAPIDELEPCDYLEAEVRRVDKAMSAEFSRNESPTLATHAFINAIDLVVIGLGSLPFLAAIALANGSFASGQTRAAMIGVVALIALFYLALTHCLCGRTAGMMLTNTRIVDATTFDDPTRKRALIRAIGYFVAIAPVMLGLLWMAGNRKRRGWQDYISGTFVARDF